MIQNLNGYRITISCWLDFQIIHIFGTYLIQAIMFPGKYVYAFLFTVPDYYQMMGKHVPAGVLSDEEPEKKVESIVRVL